MDPSKKYAIGGQFQYYGKKDFYEKYPIFKFLGIFTVPFNDPNPDQNNFQVAAQDAMLGATFMRLFDMDLPEAGGVSGNAFKELCKIRSARFWEE